MGHIHAELRATSSVAMIFYNSYFVIFCLQTILHFFEMISRTITVIW